jgi:broad specificity phosphatase PhoE
MRLYLIRHADPDYPNNTITPAGHLEAAALGRRMAQVGLTHVYTSPLGRARDTAGYTSRLVKLEPVVEDWTAELADYHIEDSTWGKLCAWDWPGEVIRGGAVMPNQENWHRMDAFVRPFLRERFAVIQQHSDVFFASHGYEREGGRYRVIRPTREKIAVFCHGGFGLCWLAHLLELPLPLVWSGFFLPPSSVTTVLFDERSATWAVPRCIGVGDTSHLYAEKLPVQPSGIKANFE